MFIFVHFSGSGKCALRLFLQLWRC